MENKYYPPYPPMPIFSRQEWQQIVYQFRQRLDGVRGYGGGPPPLQEEWDGKTKSGIKFRVKKK